MTDDISNIPDIQFENLFLEDPLAEMFWSYWLGKKEFQELRSAFLDMGKRAAEATPLSARADRFPPFLKTHNAKGDRTSAVEYHPDFKKLQELAYGGGIISRKYDPDFLKDFRSIRHLANFAIGYYFAQSEMSLYCPICMTDGLGRVLERHWSHDMKAQVLKHIGAKDLSSLWQGAMFLTERQGGSDVGTNSVFAKQSGPQWFIHGDKWFCSNVDAQAILVLARIMDEKGQTQPGTRGLGLFLVLRPFPAGNENTIKIHRIKDKLGVRSMPTGEVTLDKSEAFLVGGAGEGFKLMTEMLNMSRLYNSVASVAAMRRSVLEALAYGDQRKAFEKPLWELPLWRATMADLIAEHIGAMHLVFSVTKYLDQADGGDKAAEYMARLLTPMSKALTGKLAVFTASEAMEAIGGNAYIEEHIMPRILRDSQVLPIWEGTTNILALDTIRVLKKYGAQTYYQQLQGLMDSCSDYSPNPVIASLKERVTDEKVFLNNLLGAPEEDQQRTALEWLQKSARTYILIRLLEASRQPSLKAVSEAAYRRLWLRPAVTTPPASIRAPELKGTESVLMDACFRRRF